MMNKFSTSAKNLARLSIGINLKNMSSDVGLFHEEIDKQLAKILLENRNKLRPTSCSIIKGLGRV